MNAVVIWEIVVKNVYRSIIYLNIKMGGNDRDHDSCLYIVDLARNLYPGWSLEAPLRP